MTVRHFLVNWKQQAEGISCQQIDMKTLILFSCFSLEGKGQKTDGNLFTFARHC